MEYIDKMIRIPRDKMSNNYSLGGIVMKYKQVLQKREILFLLHIYWLILYRK